jgi:hypothetical protein
VIVGTVRIDLTTAPPDRHRHLVNDLLLLPTQARVVLLVDDPYPDRYVSSLLGQAVAARSLTLDIQGPAEVIEAWVAAARAAAQHVIMNSPSSQAATRQQPGDPWDAS